MFATVLLVIAISCTSTPAASPTSGGTAIPSVATTSATSAGVTPTRTVSPRPSAPLSERYGLIVDTTPPRVRSEADPTYLAVLSGEEPFFPGVVSPDGRAVAYWETRLGVGARVLRLWDASAPGQPRVLLTLPESEMAATSTGGGVAWSSDGKGLLIAVNSRDYVPQPVPDAAHLYTTLRQVDIATGQVREILRKEPGHPFFPIAWDRARGVSAAVPWGPGGFAMGYTILRDGADPAGVALPTQTLPMAVRAAPDAGRVLMWDFFDPRAVYVWPLTEPAKITTLDAAGDERVVAAMWRDAREMVVSVAEVGAPRDVADRLEIWSLDGVRRVVLRARHRLDAVRPDGTAALTSAGIVDLTSGATAQIPEFGLFQRVLASVVLR